MKNKSFLIAMALLFGGCASSQAQTVSTPAWSAITRPAGLPGNAKAEVFGGYSNGCISNAVAIAESAPGWEGIRFYRNRLWGHPELLALLEHLSAWANERKLGRLFIGDISQPCGLPMTGGHASHQSGLDADIFFGFSRRALSREERRAWSEQDVAEHRLEVLPGRKFGLRSGLTQAWNERYGELMREAAMQPNVERIFITPPVKRFLCEKYRTVDERGAAVYPAWLKKIRPYYEHRAHFHVRLACPKDSPGCEPQAPVEVEAGDATQVGCAGKDIDSWFERDPTKDGFLKKEVEKHRKGGGGGSSPVNWKAKEEKLPAKCKELLRIALEKTRQEEAAAAE